MAQVFRLPRIGDSMVEITVQQWHVKVGDTVDADQIVCDAETTKTVVEIPCPHAGVVLHLGGEVGDVIPLDDTLIVVGEAGEQWSPNKQVANEPPASQAPAESARPQPTVAGTAPKVLPAARKLATELGVDLSAVTPTANNGVITVDDVKGAAQDAGDARNAGNAMVTERRPMTSLRKAIAENLSRSAREIPHAAMAWEIDMTQLMARRKAIAEESGVKISIDALLISVVALLLREFPELNSYVDGNDLMLYREYNVGIAVGSLDGLMVPVIRGADKLTRDELSEEVGRLSQAAMGRSLTPKDLSGRTFTLSNVGATGAAWGGQAIIPSGTAAMLSVGRALMRPVVKAGEILAAPIARFSMTYDHRAFDGAHVAKFFTRLQEIVERGDL